MAGYRNVAVEVLDRPWGQISLESLARLDPRYLLEAREERLGPAPASIQTSWSGLGFLQAADQGRIRSVPTWVLNSGPRVNRALYAIEAALRE